MSVKKLNKKTVDFINTGAPSKSSAQHPDISVISLRCPKYIMDQVDQKVQKRPSLTRTAWIIEAIMKKLEDNDF